jgi:hypothetical protein
VTGSLTVRGRTRPISFDATVSAAAGEIRLDAGVPVNPAGFGLTYSPLRRRRWTTPSLSTPCSPAGKPTAHAMTCASRDT